LLLVHFDVEDLMTNKTPSLAVQRSIGRVQIATIYLLAWTHSLQKQNSCVDYLVVTTVAHVGHVYPT